MVARGVHNLLRCCRFVSTFMGPLQPRPPAPSPKHQGGGARLLKTEVLFAKMAQSPDLFNFFSDESPFPNALGKGRGWGWLVALRWRVVGVVM